MQHCSIHHCILFFLTLTFTTVPTVAVTSVMVKLYQFAVLPCKGKCSDSLKWTGIDNPHINVAECNHTSCWSKEGFNISHDQYLKGNLSLTITAADYSNRDFYICECDGKNIINTVQLIIELRTLFVTLKKGQDLHLDLHMPGQMKVLYTSEESSDSYGAQICNVTQHSVQCKDEYTQRVSLSDADLILTKVKQSDSGMYTIWDKKINNINLNYIVSVKESQVDPFIVKRYESVTLPCTGNCSGLVKWIQWNKIVAWCNWTSCNSLQSYTMLHEQYQKGNFSLTITVDCYSMRGWYECMCNDTLLGDQHVIIETENFSVQIKPDEDLFIDWPLSEQVELIYNGSIIYSNNSTNTKLCQARSTHRILNILKLEKVNVTDCGIYSIQDINTKEVFYQYNVSLKGEQPSPDSNQECCFQNLCRGIAVFIVCILMIVFLLIFCNYYILWNIRRTLRINEAA